MGPTGIGIGRESAAFTTRPRAAMIMRRRTADSGRPQHAQHGAVEGGEFRSLVATPASQLAKAPQDALERFTVAFDGPGPVHVFYIPHIEQNRN